MQAAKIPLTQPDRDPLRSDLLTIDEAREKLRISRWSLYRLIQQRQIASIRIGRRRLVPNVAIDKFIKERSEEID
ncbi:excisionase family DNA binding protein [Kibdelosporangium banguiense]|uniref:Excisionase family DNA binding protein n=1 Tax=Kibdelosporangium banguiense TaxID=1365924 RepID=A0ABS4TE39_9PSEU|nr:helix-turn-helix domain-containing protein [Kibdelosporangium banguiense]MBP2322675.1 excisionase family DNA binding protein [Kibdelosporangium banguiense]